MLASFSLDDESSVAVITPPFAPSFAVNLFLGSSFVVSDFISPTSAISLLIRHIVTDEVYVYVFVVMCA